MIPGARLVALLALPLALAAVAMLHPPLVPAILVLDLGLLLLAGGDALAARGGAEAGREVEEVQAVGRPFPVELHLQPRGRGRVFRVQDDAPGEVQGLPAKIRRSAGSRRLRIRYQLRVDERGEHRFGAVWLRWRSPLGLWWRQIRCPVPTRLRVYPDLRPQREGLLPLLRQQQRAPRSAVRRLGGDNEFQRNRPYVRGDSYRHIDWRATARRDELVTRQYGQERNQNLILLLDAGRMMSAHLGDMTAFDHAFSAAMAMAGAALRGGDRVGLLIYDRRVRVWLPPRGGMGTATRMIRAAYDQRPSMEEPDHAEAFRHLSARVRRRSLVVLMTAAVDEVNQALAQRTARALARRHLPLCVWLRDRGLEALLRQPEVDPYVRGAAAELLAWRHEALEELRRQGALVVDCPPAELSSALVGAYLDAKARRRL